MHIKLLLVTILSLLLLSSCGWGSKEIKPNKQHKLKNNKTLMPVIQQLPVIAQPSLSLVSNNFSNQSELSTLSALTQYIKNAEHLINKAESVRDENTRYQFNYDAIHSDLNKVVGSIERFIRQDKQSYQPRNVSPLTLRY